MPEGQTVSRESALGLTTHPANRGTRKLASSSLRIWSFFLTYGLSFIGEALALPSTRKRVESRPPSSLNPFPLLHQWMRLKSSESFPEAQLQRASVNPRWVPRLLTSQTPWFTPYVGLGPAFPCFSNSISSFRNAKCVPSVTFQDPENRDFIISFLSTHHSI